MSNAFIGQISMFGGNFAPRSFMFCNGQLLPIGQYQALFSLIGTTYGGNGTTNFALPNLQSRLPLHYGAGPGLSSYVLGQAAGVEYVTITTSTTPAHSHVLVASKGNANTGTVGSGVLPAVANGNITPTYFYAAQMQGQPALQIVTLDPHSASLVGGNGPHANLMPSLAISFIICVQGIFPSRN
ncbi:MAG: tail fiber protein [Rhizomicrobium sp.]